MLDLAAYFARLGISPVHERTRATLDAIAAAHVQAIPFENLDVLRGVPVELELDKLLDKLVRKRRGGYCFEQNTLLFHVLDALGFAPRPFSARVRIGRGRDYTPARTHLFVGVELDGHPWLVDVGVGGLSPTCALRLDTTEPQPTPHETRRIIREDGRWFHQALLGDTWTDVCEFTLEEMPEIDRIVGNWYTSAHPGSHFKNRLTVARALPEGRRVTILNRELTLRGRDGRGETRELRTPDELLDTLREHFGLAFPAGTRFPCPALDWPA